MQDSSTNNRVVIISGAGSGIGRSIAHAYAAEGLKVVLAEKDETTGAATELEICRKGGDALFVRTDVSNPRDIVSLVEVVLAHYGRIDVVVNNAGYGCWKSPYDLEIDEWDAVLATNLRSVFLLSREAARWMRYHGGGAIINIASTRAFMSEPNSEAYAASKGGIESLTHALAASFAPDHIRVNCISPGWIETGDYNKLSESDHLQHFSGRVGRPDDIARACLFLSSPDNDFITAANLTVDGGMTRKMVYLE